MISFRLERFKRKNDKEWNCRCPFCGDSKKSKTKARGNFYELKGTLMYKCFNCSLPLPFSAFLKRIDEDLYKQYRLEDMKDNNSLNTVVTKSKSSKKRTEINKSILDDVFDRVDLLDDDHEAVKYCRSRKIPNEKLDRIYYIDDVRHFSNLKEKYKKTFENYKRKESRIILPLYNDRLMLSGFTLRSLESEARLRYITLKLNENENMFFNIEYTDKKKDLFLVEGPIDSLFIDNSIAMSGTSFDKSKKSLSGYKRMIYVFDNQPFNKTICDLINKKIENDEHVVIWPNNLKEKDINDMHLSGMDVNKILNENVYQGLKAKMRFKEWRRC